MSYNSGFFFSILISPKCGQVFFQTIDELIYINNLRSLCCESLRLDSWTSCPVNNPGWVFLRRLLNLGLDIIDIENPHHFIGSNLRSSNECIILLVIPIFVCTLDIFRSRSLYLDASRHVGSAVWTSTLACLSNNHCGVRFYSNDFWRLGISFR